jgi:hypothetical protein
MRNLLTMTLALMAGAVSLCAEDPRRIDVNNLFPGTGALIIWVEPNDFGVPPGILAILPGALIHEQVFLTCGHCTRAAEPGIPPFIKRFVTFSLHVLDDPSTWIPVAGHAWHPSTLPCGPDNACHWPDEPFPGPGVSDVGLVFLVQPVKSVKPALLPQAGTLDRDGRAENLDQIMVGYLHPEGIRRHRVISPTQVFDDSGFKADRARCAERWPGSLRAHRLFWDQLVSPVTSDGRSLPLVPGSVAMTAPLAEAVSPALTMRTFCP